MPKPPTRGQQFHAAILAEYDCDPADALLLDEIAATIDEMDTAGSVVERRLQRTLLARLLAQLALPGTDGDGPTEPRAVKARKAANVRWGRS